MVCALCGYTFDNAALACHGKCPLASGCNIICCPNCGYQMVDESRSSTVNALRKLKLFLNGGVEANNG